ncbi:MAG: hypothetical protein ACE5L7_11565 [Candidatus Aminicenantales bacterium]
MKKTLSLICVLILAAFPCFLMAETADVSGDWDITVKSQRGDMTWEVHFDQDGENLTVTMKSRRGGEVSGEGTVTDNKIQWTITRSTPRGEMTMTWSGEVSGDTMSGEVQFGSFRTLQWEGTRRST